MRAGEVVISKLMQRVQLWSVSASDIGPRAKRLDERQNAEAERMLEDLLVSSPELLGDGLTLVARQLTTESGIPDLLAIDGDGRLVVLELKRGLLTRDAVAQVLDYASDLAQRGGEDLARFVEEHSGHRGIEKIDDFADWYASSYPNVVDALEQTPRMLLVGLGVDERARRMVSFLAEHGVEIRLLTFQAFDFDHHLVVARQVEVASTAVKPPRSAKSKQDNLQMLLAYADERSIKDLLLEVAELIEPLTDYRWPGKTSFSFSLQDRTSEGRPTLRSCLTVYVHSKKKGALLLTLSPNTLLVAREAALRFVDSVPAGRLVESSWAPVQVEIDRRNWPEVRPRLEELLEEVIPAWRHRLQADEAEATPVTAPDPIFEEVQR